MNRRQKIIISITGIVLVSLILIGLTYAYFLTKITGNTNTKSISVTTANLRLIYGDGNGDITSTNILPSTTIDTKTFTVKNEGNATVNNYAVYLEELVNTLSRTSDMVYTLTCTSDKENKTCKGVEETSFPTQNGIIVTNNIDVGETHSYELKVDYLEPNVDQSEDMNKTIGAKVQIYNLSDIVDVTGTVTSATNGDYVEMQSTPKTSQIINGKYLIPAVEPGSHTLYVKDKSGTVKGSKKITINKGSTAGINGDIITVTSDSQTISLNITNISSTLTINIESVEDYVNPNWLKTHILSNAKSGVSGTIYTPNLSAKNMVATMSTESDKILSIAEDDYGESYYFRGNPTDNYVNYAGMCWRIVRIEGDGSIKLILASEKTCSISNLTTSSGFATDGAIGVQGTKLAAYYGYKNYNDNYIADYVNSAADTTGNARTKLNAWLERKITSESDKALLKNETWCIGDLKNGYSYEGTGKIVGTLSNLIAVEAETKFYYTAGNKYYVTKKPSYKCETTGLEGEIDINKVGMLTFDEIAYAGGGNSSNSNFYLNNNVTTGNWWALSPSIGYIERSRGATFNISAISVYNTGKISHIYILDNSGLRPSIVLMPSTQITSGNGTIENPYEVE